MVPRKPSVSGNRVFCAYCCKGSKIAFKNFSHVTLLHLWLWRAMINRKLETTNTRYKRLTMPDIFISIMGIIVGGWRKEGLSRMAKVKIIYWSGTGNTAAMAAAIAEGAKEAGAEAELITAETASAADVQDAKAIALGCPSMGAEQLEETIMEPLMEELDGAISGKTVVLFGSYGWGSGDWMRDWEDRVSSDGASVWNGEGIIANNAPDDDVLDSCKSAGRDLAGL